MTNIHRHSTMVLTLTFAAACGDDKAPAAGNTPPTAAAAVIDPAEAYESSTLSCAADGLEDSDGDAISTTILWLVNDQEIGDAAELTGADFNRDDTVRCVLTPTDGTDAGPAVEASTTILNTPPSAERADISPAEAATGDTLSVSVSGAADDDGDSWTILTTWTVDGSEVGTSETLSTSDLARGSEVTCSVQLDDGTDLSEPLLCSPVVIGNSAPVADPPVITPNPAYADDTLTATVSGTDPDGDTLLWSYSWEVNGTTTGDSGPSLSGTGLFSKGDSVRVTATPNDGALVGSPATSDAVTISNSAPVVETASITPASAGTEDNLSIVFDSVIDADGDPVNISYSWAVNGTAVSNSDTLDSTLFSRGDSISCDLTPDDGTDSGATYTTTTVIIANSPPTVSSITISPSSAGTQDSLTATATGADADGDSVTFTYVWQINGSLAASGDTLDSGLTTRGDSITVTATPTDGLDTGADSTSSALIIQNTPPSIVSSSLSPLAPLTSDTITLSASATDPDGDSVSLSYAWQVNGVVVSGETGTSLSGADHFDRGDVIEAVITADDGTDTTTETTSSVTVGNTAPVFLSTSLSPTSPLTNDTVTLSASATDADEDAVSLSYAWQVNGVVVSGETGTSLSGADHFDRGDVIEAVITADDGTDTTTETTSSVTVGNTAPTAPVGKISPTVPRGDEDLLCEVVTAASDDDGDPISYAMTWTVDGAPFGSPSTTTWTGDTVAASELGDEEVWSCVITASDGTDTSVSASDSVTVEFWDGARTFETCGATGSVGPSQSDCDTQYASETLDGEVTVSGGKQSWTVPADGDYTIEALGAKGASADSSYDGGWGARAAGTFTLVAGEELTIVVGQRGTQASCNGGGGGGTFVVDSTGTPLVVAGGGGGTRESVVQDGCDAPASSYGVGGSGSAQSSSCSVKGTDLGGGGIISGGSWGSAGAGFYSNGALESSWATSSAQSWANGSQGSVGTSCGASEGGFGGGGTGNGCCGGGGGGGYSGGDGGRVAGGGGSYVDSSALSSSVDGAYNDDDGLVTIDRL